MKKLPLGIQSFREIVDKNYVYVDKTPQIHRLLEMGHLYFLSRPRRFGKTLLVSTFEEIFSGNKELFKGLYIAEQTNRKWETFPIVSFNFAEYGYEVKDLGELILRAINKLAKKYDIILEPSIKPSEAIKNLINELYEQYGKVVFLVDEYDKPIIDFIDDIPQAIKNGKVLKDFFSSFKESG